MNVVEKKARTLVRTAFEHARAGKWLPLEALLDAGVPANVMNESGDSLLMLAAYHGHHEAARGLLDEDVGVLSVMHANNELGTIEPGLHRIQEPGSGWTAGPPPLPPSDPPELPPPPR